MNLIRNSLNDFVRCLQRNIGKSFKEPTLRFIMKTLKHFFKWRSSWVFVPYGDEVGYQCFGGPGCVHLQGEVK